MALPRVSPPEPGSPAGLQKASSLPDPAETASESLISRTCHPHVPELPPLATQHTQGPLVSLPPVLASTSCCCLSPSRPGPRGSGEAHDDDTWHFLGSDAGEREGTTQLLPAGPSGAQGSARRGGWGVPFRPRHIPQLLGRKRPFSWGLTGSQPRDTCGRMDKDVLRCF